MNLAVSACDMPENPIIRIKEKPAGSLWIFFYAMIFFVCMNVGVWLVIDNVPFDHIGFQRLLMQPSDNELKSVIDHMRFDGKKNIVLLGDSVVWGVGVNDPKETIAGNLERMFKDDSDINIVNLSIPGNSFLDQQAIIQASYDPDDVYLFFINVLLFDEEYANRSFDESVRFKPFVRCQLFGDCHNDIFRFIPIVRNRDLISKALIGIHPAVAFDALMHRVKNMRIFDAFDRKPMDVGGGEAVIHAPPDFEHSRMAKVLRDVSQEFLDRTNVFMIILDDNRYGESATYLQSTKFIENIVMNKNVLNLVGSIPANLYLDTAHMMPEGNMLVAEKIAEFLARHNAP